MSHVSFTAIDGSVCELPVKDHPISICCHSDVPGYLDVVKETRSVIDEYNAKYFPQ